MQAILIVAIILIVIIIAYFIYRGIKKAKIQKLSWEDSVMATSRLEKIDIIFRNIFVYVFLICVAIVVIIPFYWMFNTALQDYAEIGKLKASLYPGQILGGFNPRWKNFSAIFNIETFNIMQYIMNTIVVGFFSTLGTIITTILAAFAFARLNFRGRDVLFSIFLATMMIPGEMFVITNYVTIHDFGWEDTKYALIMPFIISTYYIYLLRQNFKQIPNELYYAAKVDGTGDFKYLRKVMLPITLPTIITISILKMMGAWNSYIWPKLVTDPNGNQLLITVALRGETFAYQYDEFGNLVRGSMLGETRTNVTIQMAATAAVTLPLLLLFIFARKYIMRGVSRSGIKG